MGNIKNYIIITIFLGITGCTLDPVPDCVPGQVTCDKTTSQLKVCGNDAGNWADRLTCPNSCDNEGLSCTQSSDKCMSQDKVCIKPQNIIQDTIEISLLCHEKTLFPQICTSGCDPETGNCHIFSPCEENEKYCFEINVSEPLVFESECHDGHWVSRYCETGMTCNGNSCKCIDGTTLCTNIGTTGTVSKCTNGNWGKPITCSGNTSCHNENCGECINDTEICTNDDHKVGSVKKCIDGKWSFQYTCPNDSACLNGESCEKCKEGATICTEDLSTNTGIMQTCVNGKLTITACDHAPCNTDHDGCGKCIAGTEKCENHPDGSSEVYQCTADGSWESVQTCEPYTSCNDDRTACGSCKSGTLRCVNDQNMHGIIEKCTNGQFKQYADCGTNSCNSLLTACGKCKNGSVNSCTNEGTTGKLSICVDGELTLQNCPDNHSCNASGSACGECINNIQICENTVKQIDKFYYQYGTKKTCIKGVYQGSSCGEASCNGKECGTCLYSTEYKNRSGNTAEWCTNATKNQADYHKLECLTTIAERGCVCHSDRWQANVKPEGFGPTFKCIGGYLTGEIFQ